MNKVDLFVQEILKFSKIDRLHAFAPEHKYHCQKPEHSSSPPPISDPRCTGCAIGVRMEIGSNPQRTMISPGGMTLYGDDRITALDQLIELATQPTDLPRIVEPAQ